MPQGALPTGEPAAQRDDELFPQRVGDMLRGARVAAGLELSDIAMRTRVPARHLEAIEKSDYSGLPSSTYSIGFARAYARAVGLNDVTVAEALRTELGRAQPRGTAVVVYEPVDPARMPSRLLAWTAAGIAILLLAAYLAWRSDMFSPAATTVAPQAVTATDTPAAAPVAAPAPQPVAPTPTAGPGVVTLTATAPVWLRVYDRQNKVLIGRELQLGESFTVPADADHPMIRTGRADAIRVAIDGREVAPLGPAQTTIRDVEVSAAALSGRANASAPASAAPTNTTQ